MLVDTLVEALFSEPHSRALGVRAAADYSFLELPWCFCAVHYKLIR